MAAIESAITAMRAPACCGVRARVATSIASPVAAMTAETMRLATIAGDPQLAPTRKVVTTQRTVIATSPSARLASEAPNRIEPGAMGAARRRVSVPACRSEWIASAPYCVAKKTNITAMAAA